MKKIIAYLIAIFYVSCSTSTKYVVENSSCDSDVENYFSVKLARVNEDLQKIILNAKSNFTNRISKKPEFIIIKLNKSLSNPIISIDVKDYLYNNQFDREIFPNNFAFGCVLNNTLVLIEGKDNYEYFKDYIEITNEKLCIKITYSKYTDVYYHTYELKNESFTLKHSQCTCDL